MYERGIRARDRLMVSLYAAQIAKLKERLFWKENHEKAAQDRYAFKEQLANSQKTGGKQRHDDGEARKRELLAFIKANIAKGTIKRPDQLSALV
jgi:hypothetical protein